MRINILDIKHHLSTVQTPKDSEEFWVSPQNNSLLITKINSCLSLLESNMLTQLVVDGLFQQLDKVLSIGTSKALLELVTELDIAPRNNNSTSSIILSIKDRNHFLTLIRPVLYDCNPIYSIKSWAKDFEQIDNIATINKIEEVTQNQNNIIDNYYEQVALYRVYLNSLTDMILTEEETVLNTIDDRLIYDWIRTMTEPQQRKQLSTLTQHLIKEEKKEKFAIRPLYLNALYITLHNFILTTELKALYECFYKSNQKNCTQYIINILDNTLQVSSTIWEIERAFYGLKTYFLLIPAKEKGQNISANGNILHFIFRKVTVLGNIKPIEQLIPLYEGYMNLLLFVLDNTMDQARSLLLNGLDGNQYTPLKILMQSIGDTDDIDKVNPFILQMAAPLIKYSHDLSAFKSEMGFVEYNIWQSVGLIASSIISKKDEPSSNLVSTGFKGALLLHGMAKNARYFKRELFNNFVFSFKELRNVPLDNVILIGKIKDSGIPLSSTYYTDLTLKNELKKVTGLQDSQNQIYTPEELQNFLENHEKTTIQFEQKADIYIQLKSTYYSLLFAKKQFTKLGFEDKMFYRIAQLVTKHTSTAKLDTYNTAIASCERAINIVANNIQKSYIPFYTVINKFVRCLHEIEVGEGMEEIFKSQLIQDCLEEVQFLVKNKRIFLELIPSEQLDKIFNYYEHFRQYNKTSDTLELKTNVKEFYQGVLALCRTEDAYKPTLEEKFSVKLEGSNSNTINNIAQCGAFVIKAFGVDIEAGALKRMMLNFASNVGAVCFEGSKLGGLNF